MSIGSVLIGAAVFLLLAAYVARPFRQPETDLEQLIERQVARARQERERKGDGKRRVDPCQAGRDVPSEEASE